MDSFNGDTATELGRVLSQGVEDGLNPRDVAKGIRKRFGISERRAETIARTEITGALRRAARDENQDAQERLGIRTAMLWYSALLPTTRQSHASKHGRTFSAQEVAEFYSQGAESINCRCSQQSVLLDENDQPILGPLKARLEKQRAAFDPDR